MPHSSPKILFLAAEVQPFLLAGIEALVKGYNAEVLVVCRPVTAYAPLQFPENDQITFLAKHKGNVKELEKRVNAFNADIVWGAGWMDKDYLGWVKAYRKKSIPRVMGMDAQWKGTGRQWINALISPFFLRQIYSHAWIPGVKQRQYARKLGFKDEQILELLLTPDVAIFNSAYHSGKEKKQSHYPKSFLYAGRMDENKFLNLLVAFSSIPESELNGWSLLVAGKGELEQDEPMQKANIKHLGFLQPTELAEAMKNSGVFCLTSRKEAWGTVIQEAGAAGLPLLISKQCGAHHAMLKHGHNGYLCDGYSVNDIKRGLLKFVRMDSSALMEMGKRSNEIATKSNPAMWAAALMSVYKR